ncbi:Rossmann-like alpha/beta/alpha sandwich fold [Cynara cardunculus var. scolymus]|uniref:Rossmann-like alpha/beta/alpha sandwich fold n=1 Tax=Cynara cardunculus var. scolymus TaxID=59895 RepID=A0A103XWZ7_CYNCS|nr:Rossmann-like alpha/beta/alpha sandwich fold [Cynara cardunculus var. scolymus]
MEMEVRRIVVVVEEVEVARTALEWALHNVLRYGDLVTLLHVFPATNNSGGKSRNRKKLRLLRLKGFQLALSFKDICIHSFPNTKIEIVVTEGDEEGGRITDLVRQIGASTLVVGLHDQSFLYRLAMGQKNIGNNFNCKVLAIKQPTSPLTTSRPTPSVSDGSTSSSMDFSQIDISTLRSISNYMEIKEKKKRMP